MPHDEFPLAHVRYYARHILVNNKNEVKVKVIPRAFNWRVVRVGNMVDFEDTMKEVLKLVMGFFIT